MPTFAEVQAALERRRAARAGVQPAQSFSGGGTTGELPVMPAPAHGPPTADALRALRMQWMTEAQGQSSRDYLKALGAYRDLATRDPSNPNLPDLRTHLERELPNLLPPVTESQAPALSRELARAGRPTEAADAAPERIRAAVERGARVIDPNAGLAGKLHRVNAGVTSTFQYPLRLVSALVRPWDSGIPAAVKAEIEGKPKLTAALAASDPLGRFTQSGAETERWKNDPTSWHDVADAALKRWGVDKPAGVIAMSSDPERVGKHVTDRELFGMGRAGWAAAGTVADIGLSPSTYLTAGAAGGKGVQLAGRTIIPDKAVTAIARAPGSLLERGAEALATRMALSPKFSLQAAHRVGRAGEILGKVGPAQALEALPRGVAAIPVGGEKTLGGLLGEAFDRYHRINQVQDPELRKKLLRLEQLRESGTAAQTTKWTDEVTRLFKGASPADREALRETLENPDAFDWNVRRPVMPEVPRESITTIRSAARPHMGRSMDELEAIVEQAGSRIEAETAERMGISAEEMRRRRDAWARGLRSQGVDPVTGGPPPPANDVVGGSHSTSGPTYVPGQPAAPTAVPGTPDAKRYGAIPEHLSGQVPTVTEAQRELAGRVENVLRDVRAALERRRLIREGGRPNYFPRERTRESLILQKGEDARMEKLGRGVSPRLDFRFGALKARKEQGWINDLIAKVNAQDAEQAAMLGRRAPAPMSPVQDTTSAINTFWRQLPERLRGKLTAEPERFVDDPEVVLKRYLARATKAINDYDTLAQVRKLKGEAGDVARPFVREAANGTVFEEVPGPDYTFWRPDKGPPPVPVTPRGALPTAASRPAGPTPLARELYPDLFPKEAPPRRGAAGALTGEVPPRPAPGAFEGKSARHTPHERELLGYRYPKNAAWRQAYRDVALPRDIAAWIDAFGEPYWANKGFAGLIDQLVVRPLHKLQLPWKVAATSGAGLRFGIRNWLSATFDQNLREYGPRVLMPRIQQEAALLGLADSVFNGSAGLQARAFTDRTGRTWTARELREIAKQTGLWRTLPEAETWTALGGPFSDVWSGPAHATRATGWKDPGAALSAALGRVERGAQRATKAIGPANPISKDFLPTKHVFHPWSELTERQARMAGLLTGLDEGMDLVDAAQRANRAHVNYQGFSPAFEKYGTLAYPFAKFAVGITPNEARWALQYPGRTMFTEHLLRGGEHVVPEEERRRYAEEPKSRLIREGGGRLVGYPGVDGGALKEPEAGRATGPGRLPYVMMPPTADTFLNVLGAPARIAAARDRGSAVATELLEGALPAFKAPYEVATGRNVFTGEPIETGAATIAPRQVQALYGVAPKLAASIFKAAPIVDRKTGQSYLAVPQKVALIWRYFPNVAAADLVAGVMGVKRPYDNETAMALRLLGVTQVLHDPQITATQGAFERRDAAEKLGKAAESWTPPRGP